MNFRISVIFRFWCCPKQLVKISRSSFSARSASDVNPPLICFTSLKLCKRMVCRVIAHKTNKRKKCNLICPVPWLVYVSFQVVSNDLKKGFNVEKIRQYPVRGTLGIKTNRLVQLDEINSSLGMHPS